MSTVNDQFLRLRRNLVITSFVIIIYKLGHLGFENKLNFNGMQFKIGNTQIIIEAMWGLLIYFSWRYYTVFHDAAHFKNTLALYSDCVNTRTHQLALKRINKKSPKGSISYVSSFPVAKSWRGRTYRFNINPSAEDTINISDMNPEERIENCPFFKISVVTFLDVIFRKNNFSEFILPFVFAFVAFIELSGCNIVEPTVNYIFGNESQTKTLSRSGHLKPVLSKQVKKQGE